MKKTTTKMIQKTMLIGAAMLMLSGISRGQAFSEGFDDISTLMTSGWDTINRSNPVGTESWRQGFSDSANAVAAFGGHSGDTTSFICAYFNSAAGTGTISNWLLTPEVSIGNGDTISFYTRTTTAGLTTVYPDRLQVLMSSVSGTNVGVDENSVGDFTTSMLDINSTYTTTDYPLVWTQYSLGVSGLSGNVTGRFAFRYFVENGGPSGANSFLIGIDDVNYVPFSNVGVPSIASHALNLHTYPNPTTTQVTFDMGMPIKSNATVTIANEMGQVISHGFMNTGTKSQILNVGNFASGIYSVQVTDNENNVFRSSFVKN